VSDAKELIDRMRRNVASWDHQREAADLIEQQAARIAELEARNGAEPVVWFGGNNYCTTNREIAERFNLRPAYDAPVANGPRYDWSVSGMRQSDTGNWVMAGDVDDSAMAKDAERYRMIRNRSEYWSRWGRQSVTLGNWEEDLDAAIDAAIAASAEKTGE